MQLRCLLFLATSIVTTIEYTSDDCKWRQHLSVLPTTEEHYLMLEDCIYYFISDRARNQTTSDVFSIFVTPPVTADNPFVLTIVSVIIRRVSLTHPSSSQFDIYGDILVSWVDDRLQWTSTDWHDIKQFRLHDTHHIWTPELTDESSSSCSSIFSGCWSHIHDVHIYSDGRVTARVNFRLTSQCIIDYTHYPEDSNHCCLSLSIADLTTSFNVMATADRLLSQQPIGITKSGKSTTGPVVEHSQWMLQKLTVEVQSADIATPEALHVCIDAEKHSGTLKMALRMPVTIATILMLVSPLYGDLSMQSMVKMFVLALQTICFLFLCSIAPETGFGGTKPKIYTFYETIFVLSFLSVIVTMIALALSRMRKRKVPPRHNLYLLAKMINKVMCCIEYDTNDDDHGGMPVPYQRQIDVIESNDQTTPATTTVIDYSNEWRHIYTAANNLFSGVSFTIFVIVLVFDIL